MYVLSHAAGKVLVPLSLRSLSGCLIFIIFLFYFLFVYLFIYLFIFFFFGGGGVISLRGSLCK